MTKSFTALLPLLVLAGCAQYWRAPERPREVQFAAADPLLDSLQADVMREVNRMRLKYGARMLQDDPAIQRAAIIFSAELAARGSISHGSEVPLRRHVGERLHAERVVFVAAGENIARLDDPVEKLSRHVVQMWLESPSHNRTMLDRHFERGAVGITRAPDGYWYIVQMLAASEQPVLTRR